MEIQSSFRSWTRRRRRRRRVHTIKNYLPPFGMSTIILHHNQLAFFVSKGNQVWYFHGNRFQELHPVGWHVEHTARNAFLWKQWEMGRWCNTSIKNIERAEVQKDKKTNLFFFTSRNLRNYHDRDSGIYSWIKLGVAYVPLKRVQLF